MKKMQGVKGLMKKLSLAFLAICMVLGITACGEEGGGEPEGDKLAQIKKKGVLTMGTSPDFPPFEFYYLNDENKEEIAGSDIALGRAIADHLGVDLEIKETDFDGVIANIQSGQVDMGIAGLTFSKDREKTMQFSDGYFRETDIGFQGLMMKKSEAKKYDSLDEIKDAKLTVGAQGGSIQYDLALEVTDPEKIKQMGKTDALALALDAGDLDAIVVSTDAQAPLLENFKDFTILPKDKYDLDPDNLYSTNAIAFPLGDEYKSLIEEVNKVIAEVNESGQMEEWVEEAQELSLKAVDPDEE